MYYDEEMPALSPITVRGAVEETVDVGYPDEFSYLSTSGEDFSGIERKMCIRDSRLADTNQVSASLPSLPAIVLIGLSVFLTFIGGLIPSRKAAKSDPVTALRNE